MASMVAVLALGVWALVVAVHAGVMLLTLAHPHVMRRSRRIRDDRPPVSVLLPVRAVDHGFKRCFESTLKQAYPDFEVIVCSDSETAPGFLAARAQGAGEPEDRLRFLVAQRQIARNPKVNNLAPAVGAARHGTLLIKDSNIVFAPDDLALLARHLGPGVGLVCALPVAREAEGFAAELELAMMNGRDAPYVCAASLLGMDVGYGKVMLFPRAEFERGGGIGALADHFGDDHALSRLMSRQGLATVYVAREVMQPLGPRRWRAVLDRQLRWMVIRRDQVFAAFLSEPFVAAPFAVLAAVLAAPALGVSGWVLSLATLALRIALEMAMLRLRGWDCGWRYPLAAIARDGLTWALWIPALTAREVRWVGRSYGQRGGNAPSSPGT